MKGNFSAIKFSKPELRGIETLDLTVNLHNLGILLILSLISKMTNLRNQAESRMAQLLCKTLALNLSLQMQVWLLVFTLFVADLAFY